MKVAYFDAEYINKRNVGASMDNLEPYRDTISEVIGSADFRKSPSSLATYRDAEMLESILNVTESLMGAEHVIVVGIGGSDLGTRAIHQVLSAGDAKQTARLHTLGTVSETAMAELLVNLESVDSADKLAIFVISKSGGTAETLSNASVLLEHLTKRLGESVFTRTVFIGNPGNPLLEQGEKLGGQTLTMHEIIGGRYSVFTPVGLAPLTVLGYDVDAILRGVEAVMEGVHESGAAEAAALMYEYLQHDVRAVKYFAFNRQMESVGNWWAQLSAESLGKSEDVDGAPVSIGFVPIVETATNLHSTEQLYFSGFKGVYTDFVSLGQPTKKHFTISADNGLAEKYAGKTIGEVNHAIQKGVLEAYHDRKLPHRFTQLGKDTDHEVGLFMASRMLETMYLAHLMNIDAFNQPNVELYKEKTRIILGT